MDIPLDVLVMTWQIKTITLKQCRRCTTTWSGESENIASGDQINVVTVKIAYCPSCADDFAKETDRPTYRRDINKRIK